MVAGGGRGLVARPSLGAPPRLHLRLEDVATAEKLTVEETGPFTRSGDYVPRIGTAPELKRYAFAPGGASPAAPEVSVVGGDAYVVVLKERKAISGSLVKEGHG